MNKGFKTRKSSAFTNMLNRHKNYVQSYMFATMQLINTRVVNHDMDKINNDEIFDVYDEHFETLKSIPFGTDEYRNYELEHFKTAHKLHNQQRHHFYTEEHEQDTQVNMIDIIEVICDIMASSKQYTNGDVDLENIASVIYNKPTIKDYVSYDLIYNTVCAIEKRYLEEL